MKFWVTIPAAAGAHDAEVEFTAADGTLSLELDGRRIEADFARLPDGEVYSLLIDGRSHEIRVTPAGNSLEVTLRGATLPVEVRHPLEKLIQSSAHAHGAGTGETVTAPMPGLVVAVNVKPGDVVAAGQAIAVIEAMKMQNELQCRHAGVITDVLAAPGASVSAGQPLVRIGPVRS